MRSSASFRIAALVGFCAVALGAFGAHGLRALLEKMNTLAIWEKAVLYHLVHSGRADPCRASQAWIWRELDPVFRGHRHFQREPLRARIHRSALARDDHTNWRPVLAGGLAVACPETLSHAPYWRSDLAAIRRSSSSCLSSAGSSRIFRRSRRARSRWPSAT